MAESLAVQGVGSRDKDVAWYQPTLKNVPDETRELLRTYSGLAEEEIEAHIYKVVSCAFTAVPTSSFATTTRPPYNSSWIQVSLD